MPRKSQPGVSGLAASESGRAETHCAAPAAFLDQFSHAQDLTSQGEAWVMSVLSACGCQVWVGVSAEVFRSWV